MRAKYVVDIKVMPGYATNVLCRSLSAHSEEQSACRVYMLFLLLDMECKRVLTTRLHLT